MRARIERGPQTRLKSETKPKSVIDVDSNQYDRLLSLTFKYLYARVECRTEKMVWQLIESNDDCIFLKACVCVRMYVCFCVWKSDTNGVYMEMYVWKLIRTTEET